MERGLDGREGRREERKEKEGKKKRCEEVGIKKLVFTL